MKKQELLKIIDGNLLEKLFGFCYARTNDSYEAQNLCSDIIFALVKAARTEGEIENLYPFVWRVARNVYADYVRQRRQHAEQFYQGDAEELLPLLTGQQEDEDQDELLSSVYRQISFLTKAYREVMILFYLDGLSTAEIAKIQNISETAVRQRLFSARQKVRNEVGNMNEIGKKPVSLDKKEFVIWGNGNPNLGDPRQVCTRQFSKHIVWLCHQKPQNAVEIAEKLNVPTVYVEEELEILRAGENGQYGLLRKLDHGKYALNFILLDQKEIEEVQALYIQQIPNICRILTDFIARHKEQYLAFPYWNHRVDWNLVLWQQIIIMTGTFSNNVGRILQEKSFSDVEKMDRPFSVYGYVYNGKEYGGGWDGVHAENLCGYSNVHVENIYFHRIRPHFHCGLNLANDPQLQLAIRAVHGLEIGSLSDADKEHAAKAMECGYLYREREMLYTKILVSDTKDSDRLFAISRKLQDGYFQKEAEMLAEKLSWMIRRIVPGYLLPEWSFVNTLANLPVLDAIVEDLITKGILIPPEDGIGAEGCWMYLSK
ncbi:MAG: RNA polymerase sigma factor [Candidatus Merdivicinus sp.]|jgi:RNA polymerase sigma factor (sigma-70 family)